MLALLLLASCGFDTSTVDCGDGWTCPVGTRCATEGRSCVAATCGNGALDEDEVCDGELLGETDCVGLGYDEGMPSCDADCRHVTTSCRAFGFAPVNAGETRVGSFCDNGVVAHVVQPGAIVRVASTGTTELPIEKVIEDVACTRIELGVLAHRDASGSWSVMRSRTTRDLLAVHGTSRSDVIAAGEGAIARFDGTEWSAMRPPDASVQLTSVQVTPRHVYFGSTSVAYVMYRGAP